MDLTIVVLVVVAALVVVGIGVWFARRRTSAGPAPSSIAPSASFSLGNSLRRVLGSGVAPDTWDRIEEVLLAADIGVESVSELIAGAKGVSPETSDEAMAALHEQLLGFFEGKDRALHLRGSPAVVLVVGVNGSGKTTSVAKLAKRLIDEGRTVVLGAGDTFRAAAGEQLKTWGDRLGVRVVAGQQGGDPASVAYDTVEAARASEIDVVIIDTAGRLHGKKNLMSELAKIHRVAGGDAVSEVLIVLDATAGQNGLVQVEAFSDVIDVTGVVLTKLDGTARGGIVLAVERRLGVPVKFVGMGEGLDDLVAFDPDIFVGALVEDT